MAQEQKLYASLLAVQAKGLKVTKGEKATVPTKAGGQYSYTYASLDDVWSVLRELLVANELTVVQMPMRDILVTTVTHAATGEQVTSEVPLITAEESKNHMQDLGGAITYARRYALCAMFNVITDDDDNASATKEEPVRAASASKTPSTNQITLAKDLLSKAGYSTEAITARIDQLKSSAEASELIRKLLAKEKTS